MTNNQGQLKAISAADLREEEGVYLVDVRTPVEFEEKHIPEADLQPLHELDPARIKERAQGRPVCFVCKSGNRAGKAAKKIAEAGHENVKVLDGGLDAWEEAGFPLKRGRKGISLERQVRIGAGSLVLLGVIGAVLIHPAFMALSAFVGAGLIFAGVTDWCGMGLLLARMPWNKARRSCCERED